MTNFDNFYDSTFADFTPCERPDRDPDFTSVSGSRYWDLGNRVIRESNHWTPSVGSCAWLLGGETRRTSEPVCGICAYADFGVFVTLTTMRDLTVFDRGLASGMTISAKRRWTERAGRSYTTHVQRMIFTIARLTPCYVITECGHKYGRDTLSDRRLIELATKEAA